MRMKKPLALAISMAALGVNTTAFPNLALAQENSKELIEEITVTGSRIKRANFDKAAQVISMDRVEIEALGNLTIADTLRTSPLNSLGSFNERSGSSAQSNATINLRGLGDDRTLVMINGRRMPGSPNLGASAININMIPMIAIERLDILADGASAVYGSDAVAGVVDMHMRENFEGLEFQIRSGDRAEDDGSEEGFGFVAGLSNDKGNITFAAEYNRRDPIFDGDRDYTAAWVRDTNGDGRIDAYVDTDGISYYGKTIEIWDPNTEYYDLQAANNCPSTNGFMGPMGAAAFGEPNGTLCTYAYANVSANKAELNRLNTFMSASYELTDKVEFYSNALFSRVKSFGRYAPPAANWPNMPADYSDVPFDIDALLASGAITEDYELTGYYRWDNIGPRDNEVTDTQYDLVLGFRGDVTDSMSYDFYAQTGKYESKEFGYYYLSYPGLDYVLANNIDPFSEEGAAAMRATTTQDNYTKMDKIYAHTQFDVGDWFGAGNVAMLVGGEVFELAYQNLYDSASEAGLVGGSAGNSSSGDRDVRALFTELLVPLSEQIEINAAVRYDDYSDFGSAVSPTLSVTYRPLHNLALRTRLGKGFRAPALDELYGPSTFSAEDAIDTATCLATTGTPDGCSERQFDTYYTTNKNLDAETSKTFSLGGNWEFIDGWSLDISYWSVEVEDVIQQATTQDIFYAEAAGIALSEASGTYVDRSGALPTVHSTYINEGDLAADGIDFQVKGLLETSFGAFSLGTLVSHMLSYEEAAYYQGPQTDISGYNLNPDLRGQMVLGWSFDNHAVDLVVDYLGGHAESDTLILTANSDGTLNGSLDKSSDDLESWTTLNLSYSYDFVDFGKIKVGARNLTNEEPVMDKDDKFPRDHYDLYDHTGRVVYAEYVIKL